MPDIRSRRHLLVIATSIVILGSVLAGPAAAISDLTPGDTGPDVLELQAELRAKGFYRGAPTGTYDEKTESAVMALTKELGVSRSGSFSASLWDQLQGFPGPWIPDRNEPDRVEVNLTKQVMYLIVDGAVQDIFPISSGRPGYESPPGDYTLFFHDEGWTGSVIGRGTYNEWFYTLGLSIHGYHSVPSYPYSHGCIRVEYWDSDYLETQLSLNLPLHLWFEPPHYEKASLLAVEPVAGLDELISIDQSTGSIAPLRALVPPGASTGFFESGVRSQTRAGIDIAWGGSVGADGSLLLLYDKTAGVFQFLDVAEDGLATLVFETTGTRGWTHVVPGDYNGDGEIDLLFYRAGDGLMRFYSLQGSGTLEPLTEALYGTHGWTSLVAGDFDGDGADDVLWYRSADGLMRFYSLGTSEVFAPMTDAMWGTRGWTLIPSGDFDADGTDDIMYYRQADGLYRFYTLDESGSFEAISSAAFMTRNWEQIVPGEFDGTTGDDLAFYQGGKVMAAGFAPSGIRAVTEIRSALPNQIVVSIDWS